MFFFSDKTPSNFRFSSSGNFMFSLPHLEKNFSRILTHVSTKSCLFWAECSMLLHLFPWKIHLSFWSQNKSSVMFECQTVKVCIRNWLVYLPPLTGIHAGTCTYFRTCAHTYTKVYSRKMNLENSSMYKLKFLCIVQAVQLRHIILRQWTRYFNTFLWCSGWYTM